jgi:hypothetical protein
MNSNTETHFAVLQRIVLPCAAPWKHLCLFAAVVPIGAYLSICAVAV